MRKIHVTLQFFEASDPKGHFFEKTKNPFLDMVKGSACTKFQLCIVFRLARMSHAGPQIGRTTHLQVKIGISSTGCSPQVDFEKFLDVV